MRNYQSKIIYILLFFSFSYNDSIASDLLNKSKIALEFNYMNYKFQGVNQFGLNYELFLNNEWSLNYNINLGFSKGKTAFHCDAGMAAGVLVIANNLNENSETTESSDFYTYSAILLALVPEGISYYIPFKPEIMLVPYFNPLGFDYIFDKYSVTSSIGMKMEWTFAETFSLNPFLNTTIFYKESKLFFNLGISAAYRF